MSRRILIIDDEDDIRAVAALSLETVAGWEVYTASSGAVGIMKAQEERVYYVEQIGGVGRRAPQPSVSASPLHVTEMLREQLFDKIPTIATSATLAVVSRCSLSQASVNFILPAAPSSGPTRGWGRRRRRSRSGRASARRR